jgi:phage shock protein PspC (stress-responsive transcriptional regulator)
MNRRLYRCRHDRRLAGVASGLAEYFELDPTLMRILWFISIFLTGGLSILLYLALVVLIPLEPITDVEATQAVALAQGHQYAVRSDGGGASGSGRWLTFFGLVLILFGGLALIDALLPSWVDSWRYLGPAFFVGIGALLVIGSLRRETNEVTEPSE